jgi:hypothetical protein
MDTGRRTVSFAVIPVLTRYAIFIATFIIEIGIRDNFFWYLLDIEKYEFLVLGVKSLILLGIISLIPKYVSYYYQAFILKLE